MSPAFNAGTIVLFTNSVFFAAFVIVSFIITFTAMLPLASIVPVKSIGPVVKPVKVLVVAPSITNSPIIGLPASSTFGAATGAGAWITGSSKSISVAYFCLNE